MVAVSYLVYYDFLLQHATDIITKCDISLLQNASSFLLQNATVITNCGDFITKFDIYYKMRRLLQNVSIKCQLLLLQTLHPNLSV